MKTIAIHTNNQPEFDRELIAGLPASGPRYTSYPTADRFHNGFGETEYANALELRGLGALNKPLSLYIHIPFRNAICYYCGCNKIITEDKITRRCLYRISRARNGFIRAASQRPPPIGAAAFRRRHAHFSER